MDEVVKVADLLKKAHTIYDEFERPHLVVEVKDIQELMKDGGNE